MGVTMKFGQENSNFRHGNYSTVNTCPEVQQALAKDLLRKIITTECDGRGKLPFTDEEQRWALQVMREQPYWSHDVLRGCGIKIEH